MILLNLRLPVLATLVALVLLASPPASAHSETISQSQSFEIGPYVVALTPDPSPMYANTTPQAFRLEVIDMATGTYADVDASLQIAGPNGFRDVLEFQKASTRYFLAGVKLTEQGNHTARIVIDNGTGELFADTTFLVYPDVPFRIQPVDPSLDVMPDARSVLAYEVVHPTELHRIDAFDDLTMRVEHWSPDHRTLLDSTEIPLRHEGTGLWKVEHVFAEGHYYLHFQSRDGGFNYGDLPLLHVNVLPSAGGVPAEGATNETPAPAALPLLALGIVALALARHRRTRGGRP